MYIKLHISHPRLQYSPDKKDDCIILKELKNKPLETLKIILLNYEISTFFIRTKFITHFTHLIKHFPAGKIITQSEIINIIKNENFREPFHVLIAKNILYGLDNYTLTANRSNDVKLMVTNFINNRDIAKYTYFEIFASQYSILLYLYNILTIKALYCLNHNSQYHTLKDNSEFYKCNTFDDPDVIIIQSNSQTTPLYSTYEVNETLNFVKDPLLPNEIRYGTNKYILDYMIHSNDCSKSIKGLGHTISGITYYDTEYIYDSRNNNQFLNCDSDGIYIPCPLEPVLWKERFTNPDLCYMVNKCATIRIDPTSLSQATRNLSQNNMIYSNDKFGILVYVKET